MPCARKSNCAELRRASASNTSMNVAPMILRFCSGSVTPASRVEEQRRRRRRTSSGSCSRSKRSRTCAASSSRSSAVVDEDARQPVADRAVDEQRRDRRVDAAATGRRRRGPSPDLRRGSAPSLSSTNDAIVQSPRAAADAEREVAQDLDAALGVHDLRMEQQRVEPPRRRLPSPRPARWRSSPTTAKPGGARRHEVAVARPDAQLATARPRTAATPRRATCDRRVAELTLRRRRDVAAEHVGHQLHAVADAEHRHAERRRRAGSQRGAPGSRHAAADRPTG